jgi:D-proline reductase (dithiol) PrdB
MNVQGIKNRMISKAVTRVPALSRIFISSYEPVESTDVPWTPAGKLLTDSKIAIVTTAGVHHRDQAPFDMTNINGDPTFRTIDVQRPVSDLMITHDYYDHSDADRDINIIFPVERLREFEQEKLVGQVADIHYGFMGHIDGHHIHTLIKESAPEVARRLKRDDVDIVLLTPG